MMGKLNWKGDQRSKDLSEKARVGGFVSLEELEKKPKVTSPNKQAKKRVPFLSLGRHSVNLKTLQANDDPNSEISHHTPPLTADLFSNIPASAGFHAPWSRSTSPSRPRTSNTTHTDVSTTARKRSKTAPPTTETPYLSLSWGDKPVPLTIDFGHSRRRSSSSRSAQFSTQDAGRHAAVAASIQRPKTSQSMDPKTYEGVSRSRSNSVGSNSAVKVSRPTYSLTPAITPSQSRRPSISGTDRRPSFSADSRRGSQPVLTRTMSNFASPSASRQRSSSQSSTLGAGSIGPPPLRPAPAPVYTQPVFVDVEPTFSATIKQIQDLQGWDLDEIPKQTQSKDRRSIVKVPSAPEVHQPGSPHQEQILARAQSQESLVDTESLPAPMIGSKIEYTRLIPLVPKDSSIPPNEKPVSLQRMQSIQIAYEKQKVTMRKLNIENDTLKQQLDFARQRLDEMQDVNALKDRLERTLEEAQSKIETALHQLSVSRANEQSTQNTLLHVNRRLEEANVQKLDLLEENSELHTTAVSLQKELEAMREESETLRHRPEVSELENAKIALIKIEGENMLLKEEAKSANGRADLPAVVADLTFQLDDAQRITSEKDKYISELESQTEDLSREMETLRDERVKLTEAKQALHVLKSSQTRMVQLEQQVAELRKQKHATQVESDRIMQLLTEQLRRNAKDLHDHEHPASDLLQSKINVEEAIAEVRLKAERRLAQASEAADDVNDANLELKITNLEKEIEYHVKDIVLYKLDVKGYKKDIKLANKKIATLKEAAGTGIGVNLNTPSIAKTGVSDRRRPSITSISSSTGIATAVTVASASVENLHIITPRTTPELPHSSTRSDRKKSPEWSEKEVVPGHVFQSATAVPIPVQAASRSGLPHIIQAWTPNASPRISPLPTPSREKKTFLEA